MIFVSIGTSEPFDRLLGAVGELDANEEIVAQVGRSRVRPGNARCIEFMSFDETLEHMRAARVVVSHAGVGSVLTSLQAGRRPLLVPRLREFGEAVDDHQLAFAIRAAASQLAVHVTDLGRLAEHCDRPSAALDPAASPVELARDLRTYIETVLAAGPRPALGER
jgi:UDP-N-acetylglucosamine transferase subunit ALG13